jgi:hypothetical protein
MGGSRRDTSRAPGMFLLTIFYSINNNVSSFRPNTIGGQHRLTKAMAANIRPTQAYDSQCRSPRAYNSQQRPPRAYDSQRRPPRAYNSQRGRQGPMTANAGRQGPTTANAAAKGLQQPTQAYEKPNPCFRLGLSDVSYCRY